MLRNVGLDGEASLLELIRTKRWSDLLDRIGAHPLTWVVTAIAPVGAGALASFFGSDIRAASWPFPFYAHFSWESSLFWTLVILTGLTLGLAQRAQSRSSSAMRTMVRRLQTLPPTGFLDAYRDTYRLTADQAILTLLDSKVTLVLVNHAIRNVLGAIVEVARDFDEKGDAVYGANIMLWRPQGTPFESQSPQHLAGFLPCDPNVRGYLELIPDLSTTTALKSTKYSPDPDIPPITIPVPENTQKLRDRRNHSRDPVLPGAAQAFVRREAIVFESVDAYVSWLDEHSSKDLEVVEKMKQYFSIAPGQRIRSFGSQPIMPANGNSLSTPLGVLNLHSNRENLLQDSGQTLFSPLIEPFIALVAILLQQRSALMSAHSNGVHHG